MAAESFRGRLVSLLILAFFPVLVITALRYGGGIVLDTSEVFTGLGSLLGWGEPLATARQATLELHVWRVLTIVGVGAGLAISGGLLQGVFRNALAAPSIIGVTSGASLGAAGAILVLGGYGPQMEGMDKLGSAPVLVSVSAFFGGLATATLVLVLTSSAGRFSVPLLVLTGLAVNACVGGVLAVIHSFALDSDWLLAQALFSWGFGHTEDKAAWHAGCVLFGVLVAMVAIPFVDRELDLLAGGEQDAQALGVAVLRVRIIALVAATLAAALTVAVAGQIGFVGLVVPHMLRAVVGTGHRRLLWLCIPAGASFFLFCELLRMRFLADTGLRPGALMALIGGPLFVVLLLTTKRSLRSW